MPCQNQTRNFNTFKEISRRVAPEAPEYISGDEKEMYSSMNNQEYDLDEPLILNTKQFGSLNTGKD